MEKNNKVNKHFKDILCDKDIPSIIFSMFLLVKFATKFAPDPVRNVLYPVCLAIGGLSLLSLAVLRIRSARREKKTRTA